MLAVAEGWVLRVATPADRDDAFSLEVKSPALAIEQLELALN
jgi:hypothetical protein